MNNYVGLAAVGILLLAACGDDSESPADQPEPTELEHGECSIGSDGRERCECDSGYVSTYVYGGAEECLGETNRPSFIGQQLGFVDYMASLAAEPHFSQRLLP